MFSATLRPYQLCNAWNSIWSAWPPSLDRGRRPSFCAWAAAEPWAPINPMMPGCGWYGDQTGHRESCDSQVKGGIDFLIRSSTQIELQLNFKLSLVYHLRLKMDQGTGDRRGGVASSFLSVCFPVCLPSTTRPFHSLFSAWPHSPLQCVCGPDVLFCFLFCYIHWFMQIPRAVAPSWLVVFPRPDVIGCQG